MLHGSKQMYTSGIIWLYLGTLIAHFASNYIYATSISAENCAHRIVSNVLVEPMPIHRRVFTWQMTATMKKSPFCL